MTTYWIAGDDGSEANDGLSESSPKKDFSSSIGVADGDIVKLKRGATIMVTIANAATGNYTIEDYGVGPKPRLIFGDYASSHIFGNAPSRGPVYRVRNIRCERLPHSNPLGDNAGMNSIGGETAVFEGCEAIGPFQHGIRIGWGDYALVRGNHVDGALNCGIYCGITGKVAPSYGEYSGNLIDTPTATNDCITLHDGTTGAGGNRIIGNTFNSGVENCIDVQAAFPGTYVGFNRLNGGPLNGSSGSGNALMSSNISMAIEGNIFDAHNTTCLQFPVIACDGSLVRRNLFLGPTIRRALAAVPQMVQHGVANINPKYLNNTFIGRSTENPGASMFAFNSQTPTMLFENNIVVKALLDVYQAMFWVGNAGPVGTFDNNIMVLPALGTAQYCGKTWASFNSTFSAHANNSAETLTSPLDALYRPLAGSIASGMGAFMGSSADPFGVLSSIPPAIGAYEYTEARPSRF